MDKTLASMFTGFALADRGAELAGLKHTWGVEYDPALAAVATDNGYDTMVADVREVDYSALSTPFWLHTSPPCTTASVANADGGETELDGELSAAVIRALRTLRPRRFSLENVYGYRNYAAFNALLAALREEGYALDWWHLNAADYGVPQTRKRLILVASLDHLPRRPIATHQPPERDTGQLSLFDAPVQPWRGWLPALRGDYGGVDLLPTLPESKLANWQLKRLEAAAAKEQNLDLNIFVGGANKSQSFLDFAIENRKTIPGIRNGSEPMSTIPSDAAAYSAGRALLLNSAFPTSNGKKHYHEDEPAFTVDTTTHGRMKAVLVPGANMWAPLRGPDEPSTSVNGVDRVGNIPRAILVDGKLNDRSTSLTTRDGEARCFTVTTSHNHRDIRGVVGVRVVKMTPEALARFQSLYDYKLPTKIGLAVKGIGNGVPPWLVKAFVQANLR